MSTLNWNFNYSKTPKVILGKYPVLLKNTTDPVAIDVGCSVGAFPIMYRNAFSKFYAFDASYTNVMILRENLRTYDIQNCFPFHFAAGSKTGKIIKILSPGNSPYNNVSLVKNCIFKSKIRGKRFTTNINKSVFCEDRIEHQYAVSLSYAGMLRFLDMKHVDFLKVDIEGEEYNFLYAADLTDVDVLAIEIHFSASTTAQQLLDRLNEQFTSVCQSVGTHSEYLMVNKRLNVDDFEVQHPCSCDDMVFSL